MKHGYLFCGDLLGFSKIIKNLNPEAQDKKMGAWATLVDICAKENRIEDYQLLSDTVFAAVEQNNTSLKNIINFSRDLLNKGVPMSLPIRGAIVQGEFTWDEKLVYGKAVIEAHELEKMQNWIGVTLADTFNLTPEEFSEMSVICYPTPMKGNAHIRPLIVVPWNIPDFNALQIMLTDGGLTLKGEYLKWEWGDKLVNTYLFGEYLKLHTESGKSQHQFFGSFSAHSVVTVLRETINHMVNSVSPKS